MSLLALMADKFELEPPPDAGGGVGDANSPRRRPADEADDGDDFSLLHARAYRKVLEDSVRSLSSENAKDESDETLDDGPISPGAGVGNAPAATGGPPSEREETKLLVTFLLMVIVGTANKVFQKLQAIPMYNYPNSLNLLQNFVYVPLCFAYILPVSRFGLLNNAIPPEVTTMEKKPFAVMGFLDCVTCMLLTFAAVYLPGSLLILLPQAAIPISMILSKKIKGETYAKYQYVGAVVVVLGILVVLEPLVSQRHVPDFVCEAYDQDEFCALCEEETTEDGCLSHLTKGGTLYGDAWGGGGYVVPNWIGEGAGHEVLRSLARTNTSSATMPSDRNGELCRWITSDAAQPSSSSGSTTTTLVWSVVTILACIPMTLSSIYKEQALSGSRSGIDPIFLNGWVALFQLLFSFPLSVPAGMTTDPPVTPADLPGNVWDGIKCYLGIGTIDSGCHPDDQCSEAPLYVNVFLVFNVCFNILIVYILKFGSANVLFMASTVMVPMGNLAFALPFVPGSAPLKDSDVAGLLVILLGLVTYRFGDNFRCGLERRLRTIPPLPWRRGKNPWRGRYRRASGILKDFEWDAPVFDDEGGSDLGRLPPPSSLLDEPLLAPATPVR